MDPAQLRIIEAQLQESFSSQTDPARRAALEHELLAFKAQPESWRAAWQFLDASRSPYVQWFAASVLEEALAKRWVGGDVHEQLRSFLLRYLTEPSIRLEPFVSTKIQKVLVDSCKSSYSNSEGRSSGTNGAGGAHTLFSDVRRLCLWPDTYQLGLSLLAMVAVEFSRDDTSLPSKHKRYLQHCLKHELPSILQLLASLLQHVAESAATQAPSSTASLNPDLAASALRCLAAYVELPVTAPYLSAELFAHVFKVIEASSRPGQHDLARAGTAAVAVMTEVMNRKLVPKEQSNVVASVAMNMCMVLQGLTSQASGPNAVLQGVDEDLIAGLTEFMSVLLEQHLGRVLTLPNFPMQDFMSLLATYTFMMPSPQLLRRCFTPWATLVEHLTESEDGIQALASSVELLSNVSTALLQRVLFSTNAAALSELDDDATLTPTPNNTQPSTPTHAHAHALDPTDQLLMEDEEGGPVATLQELSERQEVISEGVSLLQSFARIPPCSHALAGRVAALLQEALANLESGGGNDVRHVTTDATTLLSLVQVVLAQCPGEAYWSAFRVVLSSAAKMADARLYSRGAPFVRLQCSSLSALRDLTRGLTTTTTTSSPTATDTHTLATLINESMSVCRSCLDTTLAPAPEPLQREAALLVQTLCQLPNDITRAQPSLVALVGDVYAVSAPLPMAVQEKLFQAVSLLILPNVGGSRPSTDEASVATTYSSFLSPLLSIFPQYPTSPQPHTHLSLRRSTRVLRAVCSMYTSTPKRIKSVVYTSLSPALPSLLPTLTHTLAHLHNGGTQAAAALQGMLGLVITLLACFARELGPNFTYDLVEVLSSQFASAEFLSSLSSQMMVAQRHAHRRALSDGSYARSISVFIVASMLRLLTQISSDRTSPALPGLVPALCHLLLDRLAPLARDAAPADLMPLTLRLIGSLLSDHWRDFVLAEAPGRNGQKQFSSPDTQAALIRMLELILVCIQDPSLAPSTVRAAIDLLSQLNRDVHLFALEPFRASVGPLLAMALVDVVLARGQMMLREELITLITDMTVCVDADWTLRELVPAVLSKTQGLTDQQRGELMQSMALEKDPVSFGRNLQALMGDVAYLVNINQAAT